jgi:hypothetical protein
MRAPIVLAAAAALAACGTDQDTAERLEQCKADARAALVQGIANLKRDMEEKAKALPPADESDHPEVKDEIASLNEYGGRLMRQSAELFAAYVVPVVEEQIKALPEGEEGLAECEELLAKLQSQQASARP